MIEDMENKDILDKVRMKGMNQSEVYRITGSSSLKIQDGKARRRERRAELRKNRKK